MKNPVEALLPLLEGEFRVPEKIVWQVHADLQVGRIVFQRKLDLAPTVVDLPVFLLKQMGAQVMSQEAQLTQAGMLRVGPPPEDARIVRS